MKPPIHVLFFTGTLGTGGSETHLAHLMTHLDRRRVEPQLLLLCASRDSPRLRQVESAGLEVHDLGLPLGRNGIWRSVTAVRKAVNRIGPDVLHSYGYPCDIYAALAGRGGRRRRIVTSRRGNQPFTRRNLIYRLTKGFVDRVVCVSTTARDHAVVHEGLDGGQIDVIPNGVNGKRFRTEARDNSPIRSLGTHGRVDEIKGTDLLIDAFEILARQELSLQVAGPCVTPWSLQLRQARGSTPGVRFVGDLSDPTSFLQSLDLFVLPSRSEGMSMALLEAMAAGLPIVATRVDSNPEVLADGAAGVLVDPEPEALAAGIRELVDDPDRASELGRAARRRVESEYTLEAMAGRYERFYERLMRVAT